MSIETPTSVRESREEEPQLTIPVLSRLVNEERVPEEEIPANLNCWYAKMRFAEEGGEERNRAGIGKTSVEHRKEEQPDFVLDAPTLQFIFEHEKKLSEIVPIFMELMEAFKDPSVRRTAFELGSIDPGATLSYWDIQAAKHVDSDAYTENRELNAQIVSAVRNAPQDLVACERILGKRVSPFAIENVWPESIRNVMEGRLTFGEHVTLLAGLHSAVHLSANGARAAYNTSRPIQEFLLEHANLFTKTALEKIAQVEPGTLTENQRRTMLASAFSSAEIPTLLANIDRKRPIHVLEHYQGYESCGMTEGRLLSEIKERQAAGIRLRFEDGTQVLLMVKYEEVTLAACVESENELFEEGMSYLPVGKTFSWASKLERGEITDVDVKEGIEQVWAKNRRLGSLDFHKRILKVETEEFIRDTQMAKEDEQPYDEYERHPKREGMKRRS